MYELVTKTFVDGEMFSIDESITIDSFSFMYPKFNKVVWFSNGFLFGLE